MAARPAGDQATYRAADHPGADGAVRRFVDEDEAAGAAVGVVGVDDERRARAHAHAADVVELELPPAASPRSSVCDVDEVESSSTIALALRASCA